MADGTAIEWTDATWNPVTGCSIVSPGCTNCYAMKLAGTRLKHTPSRKGLTVDSKAGPVWNGQVRLNEQWLDQPLRWKRPRRIFVCAHGDLFAENVPDEWIDKVFAVMALAPRHTFQVLTKRARRMRDYLTRERDGILGPHMEIIEAARALRPDDLYCMTDWPLSNVWLGVSAERQEEADARVPDLLATPAAIRFASAEPLLGPIDFERVGTLTALRSAMPDIVERARRGRPHSGDGSISGVQIDAVGRDGSSITFFQTPDHMGGFTAASPRQWPRLDWIIVGGESGKNARPMHPAWARSIRDQCAGSGTAFFFKQWGSHSLHEIALDGTLEPGLPADRVLTKLRRFENGAFRPSAKGESAASFLAPGVIAAPMRKGDAGRLLDGVEHSAFPEVRA